MSTPPPIDPVKFKTTIETKLANGLRKHIPFPPCTDLLLSGIDTGDTKDAAHFGAIFAEYFGFHRGEPILLAEPAAREIDPRFIGDGGWPPECCLPQPNVELLGTRHFYGKDRITDKSAMKRLVIGDLIWLFYMERMGLFRILGAILDDYATGGKYPVPSDTPAGLVLEAMTRQVKMGTSSGVRDRDSSYRRCLGWSSESGLKLGSSATVNADFNTHFHKALQLALEYFKDLRLADTIRGDAMAGRTSVATLTSIKDTLVLLKQSLDPFDYGRNDANTLSGIVWVISSLGLLAKLIQNLGIPVNFKEPDKFVPAAYELLVLNRAPTSAESRRYTAHLDAARYGRRILLDIEAIDVTEKPQVETWLTIAEDSIEGYRTAYRTLTGIDLGAAGAPAVEQAA